MEFKTTLQSAIIISFLFMPKNGFLNGSENKFI